MPQIWHRRHWLDSQAKRIAIGQTDIFFAVIHCKNPSFRIHANIGAYVSDAVNPGQLSLSAVGSQLSAVASISQLSTGSPNFRLTLK